jgi:hypothetical protein
MCTQVLFTSENCKKFEFLEVDTCGHFKQVFAEFEVSIDSFEVSIDSFAKIK